MKNLLRIAFVGAAFLGYSQERVEARSFDSIDVEASLETQAVISHDDAADDICIWENPQDVEASLVVATDKKYGLISYNLEGKILHHYPFGKINNVDILPEFQMGNNRIPLLCGSNRNEDTIDLFELQPDGQMKLLSSTPTEVNEVYGICFYTGDKDYVFVSSKKGEVVQYLLGLNDGIPQLHKLRTLRFSSIVEGLAGDSHYGKLYVAQERKGLWQINAAPWKPLQKEMLLKTDRKQLRPDFEGVAVRDDGHGTGTIVVSVQGSNAYALVDRETKALKALLHIKDGVVDGVQDTDGLDVSTLQSERFPSGLLIVQDGNNSPDTQNFKFVDWETIEKRIK